MPGPQGGGPAAARRRDAGQGDEVTRATVAALGAVGDQ